MNPSLHRISRFLVASKYPNSNPSIPNPFHLPLSSKFHPMQRQHRKPKPAKNPGVKPQTKSKTPPPIIILPDLVGYHDDRSSVCSNGSLRCRRAAEAEEIRLREELEVEIERELEQELIDGISNLVRRLSELKGRQIARRLVKVNGGGLTKKVEGEIASATRRWVVASFSQRDEGVDLGEDSGYDSGCSDAESTTGLVLKRNRDRRNEQGCGRP